MQGTLYGTTSAGGGPANAGPAYRSCRNTACSYNSREIPRAVFAGHPSRPQGRIVKMGRASCQMEFEAGKVIAAQPEMGESVGSLALPGNQDRTVPRPRCPATINDVHRAGLDVRRAASSSAATADVGITVTGATARRK